MAGLDVVLEVPVFGVGNVADAESFFNRDPALVGDANGALLLVDNVIASEVFLALAS